MNRKDTAPNKDANEMLEKHAQHGGRQVQKHYKEIIVNRAPYHDKT